MASLVLLALTWTLFQEQSQLAAVFNLSALKEPPAAVAPAASAERWSPAVPPGEKPDPNKVRDEANELTRRGEYEEALQRHIWFHNHAVELQPSLGAVRRSFGLSDWLELSRRYPKARQALIEIRDQKTRELEEGRGFSDLFADVTSINAYLKSDDATVALFKRIDHSDPALAGECIHSARDVLVKNREYALCLKYIADVQAWFDQIRWFWDHENALGKSQKDDFQKNLMQTRHADQRFVSQVRQLIEVLVGVGRKADAENIRLQALALVDDPQLKASAAEAETKVEK